MPSGSLSWVAVHEGLDVEQLRAALLDPDSAAEIHERRPSHGLSTHDPELSTTPELFATALGRRRLLRAG